MGHTIRQRLQPATVIRLVAVALALLLVCAVTLQRSQSAFSGQAQYGASTETAATVKLGATAANGTLDVSDMMPGDTIIRCVNVTYTGTTADGVLDSVRVYGTDNEGTGLATFLNFTGEFGSGSSCDSPGTWSGMALGTMANAFSNHGTYAKAWDTQWTPTATGQTRPFRFTVTLPNSTGNEAQGKTAKPVISWEIHTKSTGRNL